MSAEQLLYRAIHPSPAIVRSVDSEPNLQRAIPKSRVDLTDDLAPSATTKLRLWHPQGVNTPKGYSEDIRDWTPF
ncbi:hypothetical protein J6590_101799 [Homalodisca vitripennis]|nr:hypothetical protein J6590_101799 [Homalodisca vitripennis]